jgi:hypothetical protein
MSAEDRIWLLYAAHIPAGFCAGIAAIIGTLALGASDGVASAASILGYAAGALFWLLAADKI